MNPKTISVIIAGIFIIAGFAAGYLPPTYIANPETGECKYYFAGDARHHNPLPNGSWYMVGLAEENRSICQWACLRYSAEGEVWHGLGCDCLGEFEGGCINWCRIKNGEWIKDESKCVCPIGMEWNSSGSGCVKSPDYKGAITECSREISSIISKLGSIEKRLDQSKKSSESFGEEFKKLKDEFSNLKEGKDDPEALDESIKKIEWMLSDLEMRISDSDPTGGAMGEISSLMGTLSGYEGGEETGVETTVQGVETTVQGVETTVPKPVEASDGSTLWFGLALVVIVILVGIYYVSRA